jgi:hypothetical protein
MLYTIVRTRFKAQLNVHALVTPKTLRPSQRSSHLSAQLQRAILHEHPPCPFFWPRFAY